MAENNAVVYKGPCNVVIEDIGFPKMEAMGRLITHGVILKILATNICGSDLHMYRGRTDIPPNSTLGHEITGIVIEKGPDVEFIDIGDVVSVPFNVACGRCFNCKEQKTQVCVNVNPKKPGGAYGYAEMGPWQGGQAEYVMVPYADFNLLKFPDPDQAMEKIQDLALLSDVFPTGFHGAVTAGVGVGATVYIAGAGPVGIAAAVSSYLLGAACVIVGDYNQDRLNLVKVGTGCETVNIANYECIADAIEEILGKGVRQVDCGIDAIGYEAHGHGHNFRDDDSTDALDTLVDVTRHAGDLGIVGVYMPIDPQGRGKNAKMGRPAFEWGRAWDKGLNFHNGQVPVGRYNRQLMNAILFDRVQIAKAMHTTVISLSEAPYAYNVFEQGMARKFILDPHNMLQHATDYISERTAVAV